MQVTKERRAHTRKPFREQVDLVSNGKLYKSSSVNLSKGGMFLKNTNLSLEDSLILTYSYGYTPFKKEAKVVRKCDDGVGVQFMEEPKHEIELLGARQLKYIF